MLVARRDPPFHSGAHEASHISGHHAAHAPHTTRLMTALQIAGSVLAIPVGLASGYSIYHANFSPEASCQSLRANIISVLDKNADASTLRLLVRRDVAAFETSCGAVDPDAVAAFKTLLAAGKTPTATARTAVPPQQEAHEPVRQPNEMAQPVAAKAPPAITEAKPLRRDAVGSDANWVASVRRALIHAPVTRAEAAEAPVVAPAAARPIAPQVRIPHGTRAPALSLAAPAPALPPAASVAVAPAPAFDHPVPPAPIPDVMPLPKAAAAAPTERHSGFSGLIAQIPLLGRVVGH
jgi:hypothetical protein